MFIVHIHCMEAKKNKNCIIHDSSITDMKKQFNKLYKPPYLKVIIYEYHNTYGPEELPL